MRASIDALLAHYGKVYERTMRGLPIVNTALEIEAVGFRSLDPHSFGILITPWFMNLVLLPATDRWDEAPQGSPCAVELPGGKVDFRVSHEKGVGTILSAALFSTVTDFPDHVMARKVAEQTLRLLFSDAGASMEEPERRLSRRALLRRLGGVAGDE